MKRIAIFISLLCLASAPCFGQTTVLDDFAADIAGWTAPTGYATVAFNGGDGNPPGCLVITDSGWSMGCKKTFTGIVPADGDYKLTFEYKNGVTAAPQGGLKVLMNGSAEATIPEVQQTSWTATETGFLTLTAGSNITIDILGNKNATVNQDSRFDNFAIVQEVPPVSVVVRPLSGMIISGVQTITATPSGGSGSYTQAEFDVYGNGSVEYTDNTPGDGFTFEFDTTTVTNAVQEVSLKVTITDSDAATGDSTNTYRIDNLRGSLSHLTNGSFEDWTGELPEGWTKVDMSDTGAVSSGNATVSKDTSDPFDGSNALKIVFAASDTVYRYTMMSNSFPGNLQDYVVSFAAKGGDTRVAYFQSDDGTAWESTWHLVNPAAAGAWKETIDSPWAGANTEYMALCTHKYTATESFWDNINVSSAAPYVASSSVENFESYK